ncbi:hypothetical protein DH2020_029675 [Rehmannia glutinosa]|uniref:GDSL esterase/lipase n=1 Tax=Rehmannia glutinosa TaxID=99300 RepID=A0ABR0VS04_REHGL
MNTIGNNICWKFLSLFFYQIKFLLHVDPCIHLYSLALTENSTENIMADAKCAYEAIFSFGDSNSDTGGFFAAFPSQPLPYGMTYFNRPTGRPTDGRLYLDFLAQGLGLPFISPYLQSIGSDYRHGANFATSASTVLQPQSSLFVNGLHLLFPGQTNLPQPDIFGKALYTIYIGQNDFTGYASSTGAGGVKQIVPQIVSQIVSAIKELYSIGGRTFMVLNLGPVGCYPAFLVQFPHDSSDYDSSGCLTSYNNAVIEYNSQLKDAVGQVRQQLSDANVIYVDTYSVMLDLFQNPTSHGMQHGTTACCGYGGGSYNYNQQVFCGSSKASACSDPQNYVSWDGIHLTEAANKIMAYGILSGSYSDPAFNLNQLRDIQPIG